MRCVVALGLSVLLMLSGCATIFAGGPDHVPIATNPPGATVFVDNVPVGQTPLLVTLDREHSAGVIRIELAGFAPITLVRSKGINGWFWASICLTGAIGIIVDLVSGDFRDFDDTPIAIGLTPAYNQMPTAPPPGYPPPGYPEADAPGAQPYPAQGPSGYPPAPPPAQRR